MTSLLSLIEQVHPHIIAEIFVRAIHNNKCTLSDVRAVFETDATKSDDVIGAVMTTQPQFIQVLERLACDDRNAALFDDVMPTLLRHYVSSLLNRAYDASALTSNRYIIPRKGGLFAGRHDWLNDVTPLQGTQALTKVDVNSRVTQQ